MTLRTDTLLFGNRHTPRKLTDEQIANMKWLMQETKIPLKDIAQRYGVSRAHVSHINNGQIHARIQPQRGDVPD